MKSNNWLGYGRDGDLFEIIVRDASGAKIETFKFTLSDKKSHCHIARKLRQKYGLVLKERIGDRDIDWLKKSD